MVKTQVKNLEEKIEEIKNGKIFKIEGDYLTIGNQYQKRDGNVYSGVEYNKMENMNGLVKKYGMNARVEIVL